METNYLAACILQRDAAGVTVDHKNSNKKVISKQCEQLAPQISIQKSAVTPLIKQSVKLQKLAFFYLYPNLFSIQIDKNDNIIFNPKPWNWKLIPWLLSIIIVTLISGWGSCVYICTVQAFGYKAKPWLHWDLFNTLIVMGLGFAASIEIFACVGLRLTPHTFLAFSAILKLEQKCKLKNNGKISTVPIVYSF